MFLFVLSFWWVMKNGNGGLMISSWMQKLEWFDLLKPLYELHGNHRSSFSSLSHFLLHSSPFFSILLPSNSMAFHHFLLLPNPTSNSNPTSPNQDSSLNLPPWKCRCKWAFLLSVNLPIESTPQAFGSETTLFLIPFLSSSCSFPLPPFQLASSPSFLSAVLNPLLFPRFL